ncbi:SH3 domain-containing protein 21 [Echinops telfairi]|uniref:SH3 domain-containing protein 21 n=1 Tax=Echinops telfairi TaxID=9371 RepID=A0AC55DTP3_ECHTE|nr:SH3 domain-containing protein 21 [Echinops telfairi]
MEVLVLYGYHAQEEGELSLAPGDVVHEVRQGSAQGWLCGELRGRCGLFPERLVQEIPEDLRGAAEAQRPRCPRRQGHLTKSWGSKRWCKVNFNYSPEQADELKLQAGEIVEVLKEIEDGWWLGQKNGQLGAFPSNFVELLDSGPPSRDHPAMPSISPYPRRPPKLSSLTYDSPPDYLQTVPHPETYRILFDYQPEAPDELELRSGDMVKVLRKTTEDKGWWEGECQGRRGVFPDNFVLPPPPIKKLVPHKMMSQESAPIKEPKKVVPKAALSTAKKLVAATSGPGKAKPSRTSSGDNQKRPSRDSGSSGRFLGGTPGHPGRKRFKAQVPRQRSVPSQEKEHTRLAKAPPGSKIPALDKTPKPEKTLHPDKAAAPEKTRTPKKVPTFEKTPTPDKGPTPEKAPTPDRAASPEKTPVLNKTPTSKKTPAPDKVPIPEKALTPDKASTPEAAPTPDNDLTPDQVPTPEEVSSVDEAPSPEVPPEEEAPGPKIAHPGEEASTLDEILTQDQVLCEEAPCRPHNNHLHGFSPEGTLQEATSHVPEDAPPQEPGLLPEEPLLQAPCPEPICGEMKPHLGPLQPGSTPAPDKAHPQEGASTLLQEEPPPAEGEAPQKEEMAPKEETPSKEQTSPEKEATYQGEVVPPSESGVTAPKKPHSIKPTPGARETPSLQSLAPQNPTAGMEDRGGVGRLVDEVAALRRSLDLMRTQLERKLSSIGEELKIEREHRQRLEVQMLQRTQEARSLASSHSQTQTY